MAILLFPVAIFSGRSIPLADIPENLLHLLLQPHQSVQPQGYPHHEFAVERLRGSSPIGGPLCDGAGSMKPKSR